METYVNDLYCLLEKLNNNKKLQINGTKTQLLTIKDKDEDDHKIRIKVDENNYITESETMKILGFTQNRKNTMDSHLNRTASKIGMTLANLKPALKFMTPEIKKRVVTAKVKSIALYGSQLLIGQPQSVIQRTCVLIMRVNRAMHNNTEGL